MLALLEKEKRNNQTKKYSKTNNERVNRLLFLDIFSSAPWLDFRNSKKKKEKKKERKKNQKTAKTYTNISDGAPPTSVQSNIWIFFRLCQTNEMKIP